MRGGEEEEGGGGGEGGGRRGGGRRGEKWVVGGGRGRGDWQGAFFGSCGGLEGEGKNKKVRKVEFFFLRYQCVNGIYTSFCSAPSIPPLDFYCCIHMGEGIFLTLKKGKRKN